MTATDLAWTMDDLDDVEMMLMRLMISRVCNYEEDEKNANVLVGY